MEVILASSSVDSAIGSWDLRSGYEQIRYKSSASPPHGLLSVARRFLASSQQRDSPKSSSSQILFWSWDKPQFEVRSFLAEPIRPLVSNSDGAYIVGGGSSGSIYLWEVASGKLLNKWHAHYRFVTCLTLSDDESLLISGSEDGCVRVWSLMMMFDDMGKEAARSLYKYSFSEHTLRVTDVVCGHGLCNSIIISSSEDRTCKVWSLSEGRLLRNIVFPSIIDAIAMDPGEHAFYAGGRDGKIYIAALNAECNPDSHYGIYIIGALSDHSKAVTCLAFSMDGVTLVSGSEDGMVRIWDTKGRHVTRVLKHGKGPVNNVLIVRQPLLSSPQGLGHSQIPISKKRLNLSQPLVMIHWRSLYCSSYVMESQIKDLQQRRTSGAAEMELERLRRECKRSAQMVLQWKKLYHDLQNICVTELLSEAQLGNN